MIFLKKTNKWVSAVIAMILVCALTTGCAFAGTADNAATSAPSISLEPTETTPATETGTAAPETNPNSIRDSFQSTREEENLWYVPNYYVENIRFCAMYDLNGNLLLEHSIDESIKLTLISSKDGSILADYSTPGGNDPNLSYAGYIQVIADHVVLFRQYDETIEILNANLEPVAQYSWPGMREVTLILGADLKTLFVFDFSPSINGCQIQQADLETDERTVLLAGVHDFDGPSDFIFCYFDHKLNTHQPVRLDLESGTIVTAPVEGYSLDFADTMDNVWIYLNYPDGEPVYDLLADNLHTQLDGDWVTIRLLKDQKHILRNDELNKKLYLYDVDGTFLSSCDAPNFYDYQGYDFAWNEELGGYFIYVTCSAANEGPAPRLYFWDISVPREGDPLY